MPIPTGDRPFDRLVAELVADQCTASPTLGSVLGLTEYDESLPDLSADGVAARERAEDAWVDRLRDLDPADLTDDELDRPRPGPDGPARPGGHARLGRLAAQPGPLRRAPRCRLGVRAADPPAAAGAGAGPGRRRPAARPRPRCWSRASTTSTPPSPTRRCCAGRSGQIGAGCGLRPVGGRRVLRRGVGGAGARGRRGGGRGLRAVRRARRVPGRQGERRLGDRRGALRRAAHRGRGPGLRHPRAAGQGPGGLRRAGRRHARRGRRRCAAPTTSSPWSRASTTTTPRRRRRCSRSTARPPTRRGRSASSTSWSPCPRGSSARSCRRRRSAGRCWPSPTTWQPPPFAPPGTTTGVGHFFVPYPPDGATPEQVDARLATNNNHGAWSIAVHEAYPGHHWHLAWLSSTGPAAAGRAAALRARLDLLRRGLGPLHRGPAARAGLLPRRRSRSCASATTGCSAPPGSSSTPRCTSAR